MQRSASLISTLVATELLTTLESYSDSTKLSGLLKSKLHPSVLSFSSSDVTAQCALLRGYALGQANGQVSVFLPPCRKSMPVFEKEKIVALVSFDGFLLVFAENRFAKIVLESMEVEEGGELEGTATAAAPAFGKNKVLIGFTEGPILEYKYLEDDSLQKDATSYEVPGEVRIIQTVAGQNWFLAHCCDGNDHDLVWRYGNSAPLYTLSRDHNVGVMPSAIYAKTLLPDKPYVVVIEESRVSLLATGEKDTLKDSFALSLQKDGTATIVEMDKWEYICKRSRADGKAAFRYESSVIILGSAGSWLDEKLKNESVLCVDIGFEYISTGTSEDGLYQFLISDSETQALFLGSVETTFTHAYDHNDSELSASSVLHRRFSALHDDTGNKVFDLDQPNYRCSPNLDFLYTWTQSNTDWKFICLNRLKSDIIWHESEEVPTTVFSHFDETAILIYPKSVLILGMNNRTKERIDCTVEVGEQVKHFWKPEKWLFVFKKGGVAKAIKLDASPREVELPVQMDFEHLTDSDAESMDFIVSYKDRTMYYSWTGGNLTEKASSPSDYTKLTAFGKGKYCAGLTERRCDILQLPTLERIMTFRLPIRLGLPTRLDPFPHSETFFTYSEVPGHLTYWDLSVGFPTRNLDLGLSLIPSLPTFDEMDHPLENLKAIRRLWRLPNMEVGSATEKLVFLGAEYLPAYCTAVHQLAQLTEGVAIPLTNLVTRLVIYPCQVNILHLFALLGEPDHISEAMELGAKFLKSCYGTPIEICLDPEEKSSAKDECLDKLLDGLIALSDSNPLDFLIALHCMDEDFRLLLKCESAFLPSFLQMILVPLPKEFIVKPLIGMGHLLPLADLWPDLKPQKPHRRLKQYLNASAVVPELRVCPIPLSMELKRNELLDVLKDVDSSKDILNQEVIKHLADAKWREISLTMKLWTFLYWALLVFVVERVYGYGEEQRVQIGLLVFNTVLIIIEIWQAATGDWEEYLNSPWNWADWIRFVLTWVWTLASPSLALTFPTVLLNAFIGLTTFEAFSQTRFLVRMILKVCIHTIYFVLIFVYSNVTFGVLWAVTDDTSELSFYESCTTAFEMSMGNFDNSDVSTLRWFVFFSACVVNMVWLMNLMVSLLGTAYDEFNTAVKAEDVKAQFERVYQLESMVKCLNNAQGQKSYLQVYSKKTPSCNPREEQVTLYSLRQEMQKRLTDSSQQTSDLRQEMRQQMSDLRQEMVVSLRQEMSDLGEGMKDLLIRTAADLKP